MNSSKWHIAAILALAGALAGIAVLIGTTAHFFSNPDPTLLYYPTIWIIGCIALFIIATERAPPDPYKMN